jgi:hypothetical protein
MKVRWLRPVGEGSRITHAFAEIDLDAGFVAIEPVRSCGRWAVADLEPDDHAERCHACLRAVHAAQRGGT